VGDEIRSAIIRYCQEVKERTFPADEHCFRIPDEEFDALRRSLDT
jgi:ketopantoate hydroxymethyltransferase